MIRSPIALVAAALLVVGFAVAAIGQGGPGYGPYGGPGPYDMGPDGPGDMGPGMGPGTGPRGRRYGGAGMDDMNGMSPDGMGPRGMGGGGMGRDGMGRGGMGGGGMGGGMGRDGMGPDDMAEDGSGAGLGLTEAGVTVRGAARPYYVHLPANVPKPAPVVFVFHGGGGRPQAMARKTGWNELADKNGFIVVYPQGSPAPSGRGGTWNIGNKEFDATSADDKGYFAAVLDDVRHNAEIDPARVYAAGHSMGGIFAYRLACEMSGTFAAIGVVSSTMVEKGCKPTSPVALLHIHGSADERIPLAGGHGAQTAMSRRAWPAPQAGVTTWARLDSCAPRPTRSTDGDMSCETYDHCRAAVQMCVRAGGEHRWPEEAAGRLWAFFAEHPKVAQ